MFWCQNCLMPSTRPRITFREIEGRKICNACEWSFEKSKVDWTERQKFFSKLCKKFIKKKPNNCIVPWSGGKDSIYVAHKMKEFGMTPLLITVLPHLETKLGKWNRENTCARFDKLSITLSDEKYRSLAKKYFIEQGRPKHPWETAISAVIINQSVKLDIPLIVYGEDGEQEYGGVSREKDKWSKPCDKEYLMNYYWQNNLDWTIPSDEEFSKLFFTQWSRFENWRPSLHAHFAVGKGMRTEPVRNIGTFNSDSQLSDKLQDLHMYLCFVKFGFGRCAADSSIAIRDGWTNRDNALIWVRRYDGEYPWKYHQEYLDYFEMTDKEYWKIIEKHADKSVVRKSDIHEKPWILRHQIDGKDLSQMGDSYDTLPISAVYDRNSDG